jgi:hypothetical protein
MCTKLTGQDETLSRPKIWRHPEIRVPPSLGRSPRKKWDNRVARLSKTKLPPDAGPGFDVDQTRETFFI